MHAAAHTTRSTNAKHEDRVKSSALKFDYLLLVLSQFLIFSVSLLSLFLCDTNLWHSLVTTLQCNAILLNRNRSTLTLRHKCATFSRWLRRQFLVRSFHAFEAYRLLAFTFETVTVATLTPTDDRRRYKFERTKLMGGHEHQQQNGWRRRRTPGEKAQTRNCNVVLFIVVSFQIVFFRFSFFFCSLEQFLIMFSCHFFPRIHSFFLSI